MKGSHVLHCGEPVSLVADWSARAETGYGSVCVLLEVIRKPLYFTDNRYAIYMP